MPGRAATYIAYMVTSVWAVSTLWSIIHPTYHPDPGIHTVMLAVAGAFLGVGIVQRRGGNGRGNSHD